MKVSGKVLILSLLFCLPVLAWAQKSDEASVKLPMPWALKTNLLYDENSFLNLSLEVGLNNHWALELEAICPWWNSDNNERTTQMLNFGLHAKYFWKGWNSNETSLSGPFVGVHANGGIYDIARKRVSHNITRGYQGDYFAMGGLTIGYAWYLSPAWRFECSMGLGAMHTKYTHYDVVEDGQYLMIHNKGNYTWYGPTKVDLSFVWMFSRHWQKDKKKGGWL